MDYVSQIEKLYKFLELSLEFDNKKILLNIKKDFCNDLNLLGGFIKDFLTVENGGIISLDDEIYNDFIICYNKYLEKGKVKEFLLKLERYGDCFLTIVFEKFEKIQNRVLKNAIASINSCFCIEAYPYLIQIMDEYFNQRIDGSKFNLMLTLLIDMVIKNSQNPESEEITYANLKNRINIKREKKTDERLAI